MTSEENKLQKLDLLHYGQSFTERTTNRFGIVRERRIDPRHLRIQYSNIPPNVFLAIYRRVLSFFVTLFKCT